MATRKPSRTAIICNRCKDTGVYETGNNDEPCYRCPAGRTAIFNDGRSVQTGEEIFRASGREFPEAWRDPSLGRHPTNGVTLAQLTDARNAFMERRHITGSHTASEILNGFIAELYPSHADRPSAPLRPAWTPKQVLNMLTNPNNGDLVTPMRIVDDWLENAIGPDPENADELCRLVYLSYGASRPHARAVADIGRGLPPPPFCIGTRALIALLTATYPARERLPFRTLLAERVADLCTPRMDAQNNLRSVLNRDSFVGLIDSKLPAPDVPMWQSRDGTMVAIRSMADQHLLNTERGLENGSIPARTPADLDNVSAERRRRGLNPLKPQKSFDRRLSSIMTSLFTLWRHAPVGDRRNLLRGLANFVRNATIGKKTVLNPSKPSDPGVLTLFQDPDFLAAADYLETTEPPHPTMIGENATGTGDESFWKPRAEWRDEVRQEIAIGDEADSDNSPDVDPNATGEPHVYVDRGNENLEPGQVTMPFGQRCALCGLDSNNTVHDPAMTARVATEPDVVVAIDPGTGGKNVAVAIDRNTGHMRVVSEHALPPGEYTATVSVEGSTEDDDAGEAFFNDVD